MFSGHTSEHQNHSSRVTPTAIRHLGGGSLSAIYRTPLYNKAKRITGTIKPNATPSLNIFVFAEYKCILKFYNIAF